MVPGLISAGLHIPLKILNPLAESNSLSEAAFPTCHWMRAALHPYDRPTLVTISADIGDIG